MAKKRYSNAPKRQQKQQAEKCDFTIEKMDGLGQGVSREAGKVTFIGKTLPGETGTARIFRHSKGVSFAQVDKLKTPADNRIESSCPHFDSCPACHYLHTDYASELNYKEQALSGLFRNLSLPQQGITVVDAPSRLHYRNRLQLHYRHKYIGMVDGLTDQVIEIPDCQIIQQELKPAFDALYRDKNWSKEHSGGGHVELYWRDGEVSVQWDKPYAHGGFTQVNEAMNTQLCDTVEQWLQRQNFSTLLDLFSGQGNLSNAVMADRLEQREMVDYSDSGAKTHFINLDLFSEQSLKTFQRKSALKSIDLLIVDPPRKGFPLLADWVKKCKPKKMAYISCNAATLARDLHSLDKAGIRYRLEEVLLMDLFPATYHYETVVFVDFSKK
ncbi:MAG: class I SAM-dependent RNA methyltransferase [Pseudomonadales bacterium]|nr:class I SAM-dependent RNA methyltransferase [Pseudomonadales bacterium]